MAERCPAPDADGRWCEFVGENGGPYLCVRCGGELGASGSPRRTEEPKTGNVQRCRCGRPCYNGTNEHDCCTRMFNGRFCPSCEASDRFWREVAERWARPKRPKSNRKKESRNG